MIRLLALLALAASNSLGIPVISSQRTVGETCVVYAHDKKSAFRFLVTWAPCAEVDVRLTSYAELAATGELNGLSSADIRAIASSNGGQLLSAWGEFAATVYVREAGGTREITIAD